MTKDRRWIWSAANAVGLGVTFLVYLQVGMMLKHGLDFERYWVPAEQPVGTDFLVKLMVALLVAGAVFGAAQALVLRSSGVRAGLWILATALGFLFLIGIYWPLVVARVLGAIPGPVEPILFTVGGCTLAGICQFVALRRQGVFAGRWLGLWIVGLFAGLIVMSLFFMSLEAAELIWQLQVFFLGFGIAGVAALISARELFAALSRAETGRTIPDVTDSRTNGDRS